MAKKPHPDFGEVKFKARVMEMKAGEEVAFAFGLDPKGADHVLLFHHKKSGKPLFKIVQENKEHVGKGTWGFANLDGKDLVLNCEKRVDGLKKAVKLWVKDRKHPMIKKGRVLVGGQEIFEEGEEDEQETLEASGRPGAAAQAPSPAAKQLSATLSKLLPLVNKGSQVAPASKDELVALVKQAQASIEAEELEQAKELVLTVGRRAKEIAAGGASGAPEVPEPETATISLVALGRARTEWRAARGAAMREIERLKAALKEEYAEEPEMETAVNGALDKLDQVFVKLSNDLYEQLNDVVDEGDASTRLRLAGVARTTMKTFLDYVDNDPIVSELDGNEILPDMAIIAPIRTRLQDIAAALG